MSGDTTKVLDTVEEALEQIACAVQRVAVAALRLSIREWRDDDLCTG